MKEKAMIFVMLVLFSAIVAITVSKVAQLGGIEKYMEGKCLEQLAEIESRPAESWTVQDKANREYIRMTFVVKP